MALFRQIVFAAVCAGLLSGLLLTVAHQVGTVPVILRAEVYEKAAETKEPTAAAHDHGPHAWEPRDGFERTAYTALADILTSVAYALLLAAAFAVSGRSIGLRTGMWWGLAGFAAFTLAPGLGLPPEVPGTEAAPLLERQLWWGMTALLTAGGLVLLSFGRHWGWVVLGVLAIAVPHVWGAPQATEVGGAAPPALMRQFVVAVTVVSFLSWAMIGSSTAYFFRRFRP